MKKIIAYAAIAIFSAVAIYLLYGMFIGRNSFCVEELEVKSSQLPESFDGYRIVQISDIHARSFRSRKNILAKMMSKASTIGGDIIVFTGDLVSINLKEVEGLHSILGRLDARDGIISIFGNHDTLAQCEWDSLDEEREAMEELASYERSLGWTVLHNENVFVRRGNDSIAFVGFGSINIYRGYPADVDLEKAREGTDGLFKIGLSHDPGLWERGLIEGDYPLTLSGHTHGGQLSLFGWFPVDSYMNKRSGLYENSGHLLYVNRGLGTTVIPARIGCKPEITLVTLKHIKQ